MSTTHALIGWGFHHWGSVSSLEYEDSKLFYLTVDLLGNSSPVGNCESLACDINGFQSITCIIIHCRSDCFFNGKRSPLSELRFPHGLKLSEAMHCG